MTAPRKRLKPQGRLYPGLRDGRGTRPPPQAPAGARPAADLRSRRAQSLTDAERAALEAQGRKPHWRFKLEPDVVRWDDLVRGAEPYRLRLAVRSGAAREDGSYLYTLPSVVDDIDLGVTHVIRGEDHVTNTAVQIQIFEALAAPRRRFRPSQSADRRRRRGAVEAHRRAVDPLAAREAASRRSPSRRWRSWSARPRPVAPGRLARRTGGASSTSPHLRVARRASTKPSSGRSRRASLHRMPYRRGARNGWRRSASPDRSAEALLDIAVAAISRVSTTRRSGGTWSRAQVAPIVEDRDFLAARRLCAPEGRGTRSTWGAWTARL